MTNEQRVAKAMSKPPDYTNTSVVLHAIAPLTLALVSTHGTHAHSWHRPDVRHAQLFEIVKHLFINSNVAQ